MADEMSLDQAADAMRTAMRQTVHRHSWLFLIQGVVMIVAGVLALIYPLVSTVAVAVFLGWMLIFAGIAQGVTLIGGTKVPYFWLQLISAILAVIVGFLFLRNPEAGVGTLVMLMIIYFLLGGVAKIVFALTIRPMENWGWVLASGILGVVISLWLLANPEMSLLFLGIFIGVQLLAEGIAITWMAWQVRKGTA